MKNSFCTGLWGHALVLGLVHFAQRTPVTSHSIDGYLRANKSWTDQGHGDPVLVVLGTKCVKKSMQGMFGSCVGGAVGGSKLSNQRSNYSKLPLLSFYKVWKQRLGLGDGSKIVDLHELAIYLQ